MALHRSRHLTIEPDKKSLLSGKISEMQLKIPGTTIEKLVNRLYRELEKAGSDFKPGVYISDSWGCPDGVPVIGIPFYHCDDRLSGVVARFGELQVASGDEEIMTYLRHECGHALNYAYHVYEDAGWEKVFGKWDRPYRERYRTRPFSTHFVRGAAGWYAQKHPDEDFAETFAAWLRPGSDWPAIYAGTPVMSKLQFIGDATRRYKGQPSRASDEKLDRPVEELTMTLREWCRHARRRYQGRVQLPGLIDLDLKRLFPAATGDPAGDFIETNRKALIRDVHDWTGIDLAQVTKLLNELENRVRKLGLRLPPEEAVRETAKFSVFLTTLAMNYQASGEFVER